MNNNVTRLSQLRELHQRLINTPGHSPSLRWELWGRIHRAEQVLEEGSFPHTDHRAVAVRRRSLLGRLALATGAMAVGAVMLATVSWFAQSHLPAKTTAAFAGAAITAATTAAGFAMWADDYNRMVDLFDGADRYEPKSGTMPAEAEWVAADEGDWVWVYETDPAALQTPPIFSAAYSVPLLATI